MTYEQKKLLMVNNIQITALARILIRKGVVTEKELNDLQEDVRLEAVAELGGLKEKQ